MVGHHLFMEDVIMALIQCKNGPLYREWIAFLIKEHGLENSTPQIRTEAFFNSQANKPLPLYC